MSQVHMSHLLKWSNFAKCYYYKNAGEIELPVGPCGLIHLLNRGTEIQVECRSKYITEDMICKNKNCIEKVNKDIRQEKLQDKIGGDMKNSVITYKTFKKSSKAASQGRLTFPHIVDPFENYSHLLIFIRSWIDAIYSFMESEKPKFSQDAQKLLHRNPPSEEYLKGIVFETTGSETFELSQFGFCPIIYALIVKDKIDLLKYFNDIGRVDVKKEYEIEFWGNRSNGNGYENFSNALISTYTKFNLMIELNITDKINDLYFGFTINHVVNADFHKYDNDPFRFYDFAIPKNLLSIFKKDVLFLDAEKTRFFLKSLFRHIISYYSVKLYILEEKPVEVKFSIFKEFMENYFGQYHDVKNIDLFLTLAKDFGFPVKIQDCSYFPILDI